MRDPSPEPETRPRLLDMTPEEMARSVESLGHPAYRARQLRDWVFGKSIVEPERMTNLPPGFVDQFRILSSRIIRFRRSRDRTVKLLIELEDGPAIESVMIPTGRRSTACVSTQAGCAMGCVFCASGRTACAGTCAPGKSWNRSCTFRGKPAAASPTWCSWAWGNPWPIMKRSSLPYGP